MFTQSCDANVMGHWCSPPEQVCVNIPTGVASVLLWSQISLLQVHVRERLVSTARPLELKESTPISGLLHAPRCV
jgi:hypothetical protein